MPTPHEDNWRSIAFGTPERSCSSISSFSFSLAISFPLVISFFPMNLLFAFSFKDLIFLFVISLQCSSNFVNTLSRWRTMFFFAPISHIPTLFLLLSSLDVWQHFDFPSLGLSSSAQDFKFQCHFYTLLILLLNRSIVGKSFLLWFLSHLESRFSLFPDIILCLPCSFSSCPSNMRFFPFAVSFLYLSQFLSPHSL